MNVLIRTCNKCSDSVKIELFKSYGTTLYCLHLRSDYTNSAFSKIPFIGIIFFSASTMFTKYNVYNFKVLIR